MPTLVDIVIRNVIKHSSVGTDVQRKMALGGVSLVAHASLIRNPSALAGSIAIKFIYKYVFQPKIPPPKPTRPSEPDLTFATSTANEPPPLWSIDSVGDMAKHLFDRLGQNSLSETVDLYHDANTAHLARPYLIALSNRFAIGSTPKPGLPTVQAYLGNISNPHVLAGIFKALLQRLETPLLEPLRDVLVNMETDSKVQEALATMQPNARRLLAITIRHLAFISERQALNNMTSSNLARIFVPLLFKIEDQDKSEPTLRLVRALQYLIENKSRLEVQVPTQSHALDPDPT
jgi:hypothetical protein